jgi:NADH-quinone oxidoreductase subunit M
MGLPLMYNFVGEALCMVGIGLQSWELAMLAGLGLLASALYSIWLANRLLFGNVKVTFIEAFSDVSGREFAILVSLAVCTLWFGIDPSYFDALMENAIWWLLIN